MRIKTTYSQLKVGDRFFYDLISPKSSCRIKTTSNQLTHFANGNELFSPETWRDADEVWIDIEEATSIETSPVDTEEKLKQQTAEIERLKACIQDARSLMVDYDGYKTYEGLKVLIEQVDFLLMTHEPLERKKAGER